MAPVSFDGVVRMASPFRQAHFAIKPREATITKKSAASTRDATEKVAGSPVAAKFRLTVTEALAIRSQPVTASKRNIRYRPYAFTEQGVAMLSGVLQSDRATEVNIAIMRAFVRMRRMLSANRELAGKLEELENKLIAHDYQIGDIVEAIRKLMRGPRKLKPRIGYL